MYGAGRKRREKAEDDITGNLRDCLALKNIEKRLEVKYMDKNLMNSQ
jgi:hypothetical protein